LTTCAVGVWPLHAQDSSVSGSGFRGAAWGISQAEVLALEATAPFRVDESVAMFTGSYGGHPAHVIYFFVRDELVMGFYQLLIENEELDEYFENYYVLRDAISDQIGIPSAENWQFIDEQVEGQREMWGDALGFGLLKVETGWIYDRSAIGLRLSGGDFAAHLMVIHTSQDELNRGRRAYRRYFANVIGVPNPYFSR